MLLCISRHRIVNQLVGTRRMATQRVALGTMGLTMKSRHQAVRDRLLFVCRGITGPNSDLGRWLLAE